MVGFAKLPHLHRFIDLTSNRVKVFQVRRRMMREAEGKCSLPCRLFLWIFLAVCCYERCSVSVVRALRPFDIQKLSNCRFPLGVMRICAASMRVHALLNSSQIVGDGVARSVMRLLMYPTKPHFSVNGLLCNEDNNSIDKVPLLENLVQIFMLYLLMIIVCYSIVQHKYIQ